MFSLDDRAGNVATTLALFMVAAAVLYLARGAFLILLLSLLFAYLLEPAVTGYNSIRGLVTGTVRRRLLRCI